jgi:hypothetical protein
MHSVGASCTVLSTVHAPTAKLSIWFDAEPKFGFIYVLLPNIVGIYSGKSPFI